MIILLFSFSAIMYQKRRLGNCSFSSFCQYLVFLKREIFLGRYFKKSDKEWSLFRSLQKERQGAIRSFALLKRATRSESLFCSLPKERQRANCSFAPLKRVTKSKLRFPSFKKRDKEKKSLFRSLQKERQRAFCSFALYQKSKRAHKRANCRGWYFEWTIQRLSKDWRFII